MTQRIKRIKPRAVALVLLVLGVMTVLLSGRAGEEKTEDTYFFDEVVYEETLEKRLKEIIERIDGVGEAKVMITLEGSAFYTYATDTANDTKADGNVKRESTVVLSAKGSSTKEAVISGYTLPAVKGAAIVCSRTLTPTLQGKVIGIAASALGIPTSKIFVTN